MSTKKTLSGLVCSIFLSFALMACGNTNTEELTADQISDGKADKADKADKVSPVSITADKTFYGVNSAIKFTLKNNLEEKVYVDHCSPMKLMVFKEGNWVNTVDNVNCTADVVKVKGSLKQVFTPNSVGTYKVVADVGFGCEVNEPIGQDYCSSAGTYESSIFNVVADPKNRSVTNSATLTSLLDELSEIASNGASLEYFGYDESAKTAATKSCKVVTSENVLAELNDLFSTMFTEADEAFDEYEAAMKDLAAVLNGEKYMECKTSSSGGRSLTHATYYMSLDSSYSIMFELGYED